MRVLTPEQLAARLGDRFRLLTGGGRTALRRQQTLQATVDWSHDLLAEPERALFRRLAVFPGGAAGGFPLEAAEAVAPAAPATRWRRPTCWTCSRGWWTSRWCWPRRAGREERYRLLETLRQYAEERLLQAGEAAAVRDRHRDWCLALARAVAAAAAPATGRSTGRRPGGSWTSARACGPRWRGAPPAPPRRRPASSCWPTRASCGAWRAGTMSEHRRWLETFLGLAPARTATRARCLLVLDHCLRWHHEFARAGAAAREARGIYEALGDPAGAALAAVHEGLVAANLGAYDRGVALIAPALAGARARGDLVRVEEFSRDLGVIAFARGDLATARARLEESRALAERLGLPPHHGVLAAARLATLDRLEGDPRRARQRLEATLARVRGDPALDAPGVLAVAVSARPGRPRPGRGAVRGGAHPPARPAPVPAPRRRRGRARRQSPAWRGCSRSPAARPGAASPSSPPCAGDGGEGPIGTVHIPEVRVEAPGYLERARAALGETAYAAAWAAGQAMTLEQAIAYALEDAPDAA